MLIDFSFKNFKCFRGTQQFTMSRPAADVELQSEGWPVRDVSTVAAVFGGNASGKSSFLEALGFLCGLVRNSAARAAHTQGTGRPPFLLDEESPAATTDYYVEFLTSNSERYIYQVSLDDESVVCETLSVYTSTRKSLVFERTYDGNADAYGYSYGKGFRGQRKAYEKMARPQALYLSTLHAANCESTEAAFEELANGVQIYDSEYYHEETSAVIKAIDAGGPLGSALSEIMARAGLGISSVKVEDKITAFMRKVTSQDHPGYEHLKSLLGIALSETSPDIDAVARDERVEAAIREGAESASDPEALAFTHHGSGAEAVLSERQESRGTLASLAFFSVALRVLSKPSVCLVDELDSSLHPKYVRELVRLFRDPATNPHQSQLIFTTHDTTLMGHTGAEEDVLDRDQIWFAEKDLESGESELYPLTELHVRRGENYARNYLNEVYGAVPDLDFHGTFARALDKLSASE